MPNNWLSSGLFHIKSISKEEKYLIVFSNPPFWTNFLVRIYAWMIILRTEGFLNNVLLWMNLINKPFEILFTDKAVLIGMVYGYLPFMILPLYASIEKLDRNYLDAARDLGATPIKTFWRVIIPLTKPGIIAGSILVFVPSLGAFIIPDLLGGAKYDDRKSNKRSIFVRKRLAFRIGIILYCYGCCLNITYDIFAVWANCK